MKSLMVYVGMWYTLRPQKDSHLNIYMPTLGPKKLLYSYMDPLESVPRFRGTDA